MTTEQYESKRLDAAGASAVLAATYGDQALAVALVEEGVVTRDVVDPLLEQLRAERAVAVKNGQTLTLLELLANEQIAKLDDLLALVVERSQLPYLSLSTYDVDRDIACLLPREIAFEFCLIPFDQISRCVLIAAANPLDPATRDRIRVLIDYDLYWYVNSQARRAKFKGAEINYDLFWYVSSPVDITSALRQAHGLEQLSARRSAKV